MDLDTVRLGWSSGLLDLDGFRWIGLEHWFFRIWILLVFSLGLDLDGFSFSTGFLVFFGSGSFGLLLDWIGLVFLQIRIFSFQSGLDLKRYFQKALKVKKKKLINTGF